MTTKCFKLIVNGRVQGVGFRYGTNQIANRLEITGSVRNLPDGTVEIIAEGAADILDSFIELIKQGPTSFARVTNVQITELPIHHYRLFMIK